MSKRLSRGVLAAISAPALPIAGLGLPLVVYLPPFYADTVGLGLTLVGQVFLIARLFDVGVDPFFGLLADKLRVPLGRRKFWLLLSLPVIVGATAMIFMPPQGAGGGYLLIWILVLYLGYTMVTISVVSWSAELSADYDERTRVQGWYQTALMIGLVAVLVVPVVVERRFGGDSWLKMSAIGWFIMVLMPPAVLWAVGRVPEVPLREDAGRHWREAIGAVIRSRPLRFVLAADLLFGLSSGVAGAMFVFVMRDGLGIRESYNLLLLVFFVVGCVFAPFWAYAGRRWEKHRALLVAAIYNMIVPLLFLLVPQGNFALALAVTVLFGFSYASARLLLKSMMADVTDHDRLMSGRMQAGIFFSLLLTTEKLGQAFAVGIAYPVLDWMGFMAGSETNSSGVRFGMLLLFVGLPFVLHAIAAWAMYRYPLGRLHQHKMREELTLRYGE